MKKAEPKWWAWGISVVSLGIFAFFVVLVGLPVDQYEKALLAREVRENVRQQLYVEAKANAAELLNDSVGERMFGVLDPHHYLLWRVDPAVIQLINVVEALQKNDMKMLSMQQLDASVFGDGAETSLSQSAVSAQVEALKIAMRTRKQLVERLDSIEASRARSAPEYIAARDTLRLFLGFANAESEAGGFNGREEGGYSFYEAGVLEGLPRIPELPAQYDDLQELRKALEDLGVQVQVRGANPMQDFADTLRELRARSAKVLDALKALKSSEAECRHQLEIFDVDTKNLQKGLKKTLEARLSLLLSPPTLFERLNILNILQ